MVRWELVSFVNRSKQRKKIMPVLAEPITPSEISKRTGLYATHVSRALNELIEKGLIECLTPTERTGRLYRLTKLGKNVLSQIEKM